MKIFNSACIILALLGSFTSCSKKQKPAAAGDLSGLKDFPKEWVLVDDIAPPNSISRNYVIPIDSNSSFLGGIIIKQMEMTGR